jgi:hypothetical protein
VSDGSGGLGMAWYSPEAWEQLAAMPEARIEMGYQDFVYAFARGMRECAVLGVRAEKIEIDVAKMTEWCHRNGYEVDAKGRATYCTVVMMARDDRKMLNAPVVDKTRVVQ